MATTITGALRIDYHERCEYDCPGAGWYFDLANEDSGAAHYSLRYDSEQEALAAAEAWESEQNAEHDRLDSSA